ncbi:MAG: 2OG-Fe(II) oxygenase [Caulobacterales bacterium]|nr:2OG-Fe(II) oxygenase [Caulobacterales bacterium]
MSTSPIELNPGLDIEALKAAFAPSRRLHIPSILKPASAEAVADVLEAETRWKTTVAAGGAFFEMPLEGTRAADPSKQAWLDAAAVDGSSPLTQYIFDTRRLGPEQTDGPQDAADAVHAFLNSPDFIAFLRAVTGDDRIDLIDAQASRYRPGHVLTAHNDVSAGKNRLYAYVLNFTREWRPDWGGNLLFYGSDGHIEHGWVPAFNALNLFNVPTKHAVTEIASFAPRFRYSIVGWVRSNQTVGPQTRDEAKRAY